MVRRRLHSLDFVKIDDRTGPCQFPTLGFVVEQYERMQNFIAETFWYIHVGIKREDSIVEFKWRRNRLFDYDAAFVLYELCLEDPTATVLSVQTKPASKWRVRPSSMSIVVLKIAQEATAAHDGRAAKVRVPPSPPHAQAHSRCASTALLSRSMIDKGGAKIAEGLYQKGYVSYPRTETDQFDREFNFHELIEKHTGDANWGAFATGCVSPCYLPRSVER